MRDINKQNDGLPIRMVPRDFTPIKIEIIYDPDAPDACLQKMYEDDEL